MEKKHYLHQGPLLREHFKPVNSDYVLFCFKRGCVLHGVKWFPLSPYAIIQGPQGLYNRVVVSHRTKERDQLEIGGCCFLSCVVNMFLLITVFRNQFWKAYQFYKVRFVWLFVVNVVIMRVFYDFCRTQYPLKGHRDTRFLRWNFYRL